MPSHPETVLHCSVFTRLTLGTTACLSNIGSSKTKNVRVPEPRSRAIGIFIFHIQYKI